ncbi:allantoinase [Priestia endophytica]|uniref:Allantoinase n=1 Tax=Priestia endophytica DSM 13796 TaxID=1121089 RepID=A0A1I6BLM8_9BACI|nr:allantoinase [Priestia endophytica]KYG35357.1 cyclic amidohydrolase [Priestia endophytica]SFQ81832.1 allantoinase [Priestia endophytica DSM 13796]
MSLYDVVIRNGNVVLSTGVVKTDIGVKDGKVAAIEKNLHHQGEQEWNAEHQYIFPGMIDVHVHFSEPGREHWEGFHTGSMMMAAGGCTTYFDMPLNGIPSTVNKDALDEKARIGNEKSVVDFGLWGGLVPGNEGDLKPLAESGVIGFKAFLSTTGNKEFEAVDDMTLLDGMKQIARLGKVLALHSESASMTNWLKKEKENEGKYSADDYLETRPITAEVEAVERAIYYAELTNCPLHFVHISSAKAMEKIQEAKEKGMNITVETCPHYLLFHHGHLRELGAVAKCAPPLREDSERQKLIELLKSDRFDMISSDHSPCPYDLKDPNVHNLFEAWGGISGGQFSLLASIELSLAHNIPFEKVAKWTASNPAERFGISDRKGHITKGADADFAFVTLDESYTVTAENYYAKHKESLYIGHTFPCKVVGTMNRGKLVFKDGEIDKQADQKWLKPQNRLYV